LKTLLSLLLRTMENLFRNISLHKKSAKCKAQSVSRSNTLCAMPYALCNFKIQLIVRKKLRRVKLVLVVVLCLWSSVFFAIDNSYSQQSDPEFNKHFNNGMHFLEVRDARNAIAELSICAELDPKNLPVNFMKS